MAGAGSFAENLRAAREARGWSLEKLAAEAETSKGYLSDLERGQRLMPPGKKLRSIADALGMAVEQLAGPGEDRFVDILGRVGADPEGTRLQTTGQPTGDMVPPPPGGTSASVAVEVEGNSMRGYADDGALVYFEIQRLPPSEDMIGEVVVVETEDGRVLLKRLRRGREPGHFDLESHDGETIRGVRLRWAAEPTAVIPPKQARRIILRKGEAA